MNLCHFFFSAPLVPQRLVKIQHRYNIVPLADDEDNPEDIRTIRLLVEKRKRYVYAVHCPDDSGINCPMVIDTTGLYFRREGLGGLYLVSAELQRSIRC